MKNLLAAAALVAAGTAGGAEITWELGPTFGGANGHLGILTNGALVHAVHLAGSPSDSLIVDPSGLNIAFTNINSAAFNSSFSDPLNNIGDPGWSQIVRVFEWNSGTDVDAAAFLDGLTLGQTYQVQFFSGRSHPCCADRTLKFGDGLGHFSDPVSQAQGVFQSVVGTFVADATTQRIVFDDSSNNPNLSAYVLRDVTLIPEPGTWALMCTGLVTFGAWARRRSAIAT